MKMWVGLLVATGFVLAGCGGHHDDKRISLDTVPQPVMKSIKHDYPTATTRYVEIDQVDRTKTYTVHLNMPDGKEKIIRYASNGEVKK